MPSIYISSWVKKLRRKLFFAAARSLIRPSASFQCSCIDITEIESTSGRYWCECGNRPFLRHLGRATRRYCMLNAEREARGGLKEGRVSAWRCLARYWSARHHRHRFWYHSRREWKGWSQSPTQLLSKPWDVWSLSTRLLRSHTFFFPFWCVNF